MFTQENTIFLDQMLGFLFPIIKYIRNTDHILRALFTTPEIRCCRLMWQIKMFHYFDGPTPIFNSRLPGIYLVIWFARQSQYYILCIPEKKKKSYGIFPFITFFGNFGDSPQRFFSIIKICWYPETFNDFFVVNNNIQSYIKVQLQKYTLIWN